MRLPRMKTTVSRLGPMDELYIQWGKESLMTTAKKGHFTPARIYDIKRRFAHISLKDLSSE